MVGELDANFYIFGLAGGMFLYISLVDMVPEMNEREGAQSAFIVFFDVLCNFYFTRSRPNLRPFSIRIVNKLLYSFRFGFIEKDLENN